MYVTTFSSAGTALFKGGGVRPQPFFRSAAYRNWAELSIYIGYGMALKMF